jgi:hypothetical protein
MIQGGGNGGMKRGIIAQSSGRDDSHSSYGILVAKMATLVKRIFGSSLR